MKLKVNVSTESSPIFVEVDAKDVKTTNGIHFRVSNNKLQFSTDGTVWNNI